MSMHIRTVRRPTRRLGSPTWKKKRLMHILRIAGAVLAVWALGQLSRVMLQIPVRVGTLVEATRRKPMIY